MAALGLKELLEMNYKEDALHIIAFDYKPYLISSNEIIQLRMNIMMLDNNLILIDICDEMARMNGNSTVTFIDDPSNLKEFVIKSFTDHKRKLRMYQ